MAVLVSPCQSTSELGVGGGDESGGTGRINGRRGSEGSREAR